MYIITGQCLSIGDIKTLVVFILEMNITFNQLTSIDLGRYLVQNQIVKFKVSNQQLHDQLDYTKRQIGETFVLEYGTGSVKSIDLTRIVEVDRKKENQVKMQWLDKVFNLQYTWVHVSKAITISYCPSTRSAKILQQNITNTFLVKHKRTSEMMSKHNVKKSTHTSCTFGESNIHPRRNVGWKKPQVSNNSGVNKFINASFKESCISLPWGNKLVCKNCGKYDALNNAKNKLKEALLTINNNTITNSSNIVGGWVKHRDFNIVGDWSKQMEYNYIDSNKVREWGHKESFSSWKPSNRKRIHASNDVDYNNVPRKMYVIIIILILHGLHQIKKKLS